MCVIVNVSEQAMLAPDATLGTAQEFSLHSRDIARPGSITALATDGRSYYGCSLASD